LTGTAGNDTFFIPDSPPGVSESINGGPGDDLFVFGNSAGLINNYFLPVSVDGGPGNNALFINNAGSTQPGVTYLASNIFFAAVSGFLLNYTATGGTFGNGITVLDGQGSDYFNVEGVPAGAAAFVNTGAGDDFIVVSSDPAGGGVLSNLQGTLSIDAGTGTN